MTKSPFPTTFEAFCKLFEASFLESEREKKPSKEHEMGYQSMGDKKKIVDKERVSGGKNVKRKDMPITDKLEVGKKDAVEERTRAKTKQKEDAAYKVKMKRDKNQ
jgi:hypothetical protein